MKEIDEGCNDELVYDANFSKYFEIPLLEPSFLNKKTDKNFVVGLNSLDLINTRKICLLLHEDKDFFRNFLCDPDKTISKISNINSIVVFPTLKSFTNIDQSIVNQLAYLYLVRTIEYTLLKSQIKVIPWIPLYCKDLTINNIVDEIPILSGLNKFKEFCLLGPDLVGTMFTFYEYFVFLSRCIKYLNPTDLYILTRRFLNKEFINRGSKIHFVKFANVGEI